MTWGDDRKRGNVCTSNVSLKRTREKPSNRGPKKHFTLGGSCAGFVFCGWNWWNYPINDIGIVIRELKGFLTYSPMNPTTVMELSQKVLITAQKGTQMACVWKKPLEQLGLHPGRLTAGTDSHHTIKERKTIWTKPSWLCSMLIFQGVVSFSSGEGGSKRLGWKKKDYEIWNRRPACKTKHEFKNMENVKMPDFMTGQPTPPTYPPEIRSY